jgi:methylated-DNA-[protein]-cysteine S-methyltransferase
VRYSVFESPIGQLVLSRREDALSGIAFSDSKKAPEIGLSWSRDDGAFARVAEQLSAYFAGELTRFELDLAPQGTVFQQRVWAALQRIPYGATTTYGKLAQSLGDPRSTRAVGLANGRNPIPIVIPCHRVIGADGGLTGYGGGMHRKQWLLAHEGLALPVESSGCRA